MTIRQLIDKSARRFPERPAYHFRKKGGAWLGIRYCEFRDRLRVVSEIVGLLGVKPRSGAVAIMLDNSPEWLETFAGAAYCGVTAVPIDPSLESAVIERIMRESGVSVVFAGEGARGLLDAILPKLPSVRAVVLVGGDPSPAECAGRKTFGYAELQERLYLQARISDAFAMDNWPAENDIAAIMHGVDSSGHFVCESLSHSSLCGMAETALPESFRIGSRDRFLALAPFHGSRGLVADCILPIARGACIQLPDNKPAIGEDVRFLMPTVIAGTAPFFERLLATLRDCGASSAGALRAMGLGAFARKRALSAVGGHLHWLLCIGAVSPREETAEALAAFDITVADLIPATATCASSIDAHFAGIDFSIQPSTQQQGN